MQRIGILPLQLNCSNCCIQQHSRLVSKASLLQCRLDGKIRVKYRVRIAVGSKHNSASALTVCRSLTNIPLPISSLPRPTRGMHIFLVNHLYLYSQE